MTTALLVLLAALLVAALIGQIRINRSRTPRPQLPPPDPRQALAHGLAWTFEDGTVVNHPLCPDPIKLGTYGRTVTPTPTPSAPVVMTGEELDEIRRQHYDYRHEHDRRTRDEWLSTWCRPATAADYASWLHVWLAAGGRTTHDYDYDFPRAGWYVLRDDVIPTSPPTCHGALSFEVIVPSGSMWQPRSVPRTFHDACGHSTFYFTDPLRDGRPAIVGSGVPTYRDVRAILAGH
jgi:hypothetical protein